MSSIPPIPNVTVALLAHDEPELGAILCEKMLRAGAARVVLFDGTGTGLNALRILELIPVELAGGVAFSGWSEALSWGNLLPFVAAAITFARQACVSSLMLADSDFVPVRRDAFNVIGRTVAALEAQHSDKAVIISAWSACVHIQKGYLGASESYPSRCFMNSALLGLNPLADHLRRRGWSGEWAVGTFNPGTVFNRRAIEICYELLQEVSMAEIRNLDTEVVFAAEEVFLQTALDLAGCVFHSPVCMRGVRWRPAWRPQDLVASDMIFVHPVPRLPTQPIWQTPHPVWQKFHEAKN